MVVVVVLLLLLLLLLLLAVAARCVGRGRVHAAALVEVVRGQHGGAGFCCEELELPCRPTDERERESPRACIAPHTKGTRIQSAG